MTNIKEKRPWKAYGRISVFNIFGETGGELKGYTVVNNYEDGRPCEVFFKIAKEGGTLSGVMDGLAIITSHALQRGVPIEDICSGLIGIRFEPFGLTDDPDIPVCRSVLDYIGTRLALDYCTPEQRAVLGL